MRDLLLCFIVGFLPVLSWLCVRHLGKVYGIRDVEDYMDKQYYKDFKIYEKGFEAGEVTYELKHCPACANVADLQEALDENAKLRELCGELYGFVSKADRMQWPELADRMRELEVCE